MRTIVDLPDEQIEALKRISDTEQVSRAELIRRAVAEYLVRHRPGLDDAAVGLWRGRAKDGLDYEDAVRAEWDA
jgi:metal-responsive CopG/Arc/MetJ family transcriptional regulator